METLILQGILPFDQLERVSRNQADDESAITGLVTQGLVTPVQLARARATQAGIGFVELARLPRRPHRRRARARRALPSPRRAADRLDGDGAQLAMVDPATFSPSTTCAPPPACRCDPVVAERADLLARDRPLPPRRRRAQRPHHRRSRRRTAPQEPRSAIGDADDDDAPIVRFVNLLDQPGDPGPRLRHPHRAGRVRRAACGTASTACCTRCSARPRASRTASSRASRS